MKRHEEALASFDRALAIEPRNGRLFWQRARSLCAIGRFEHAVADFDRAITALGEKRDLLLEQAVALRHVGRVTEALASVEKILAWAPDDPSALDARAACLVELRRWTDACQAYEKLVAADPDDVDALASLAGVLNRIDEPERALAACEKVLARQPAHLGALLNRSGALLQCARIDEALAAVEAVLAQDADDPAARWNRARLRLLQGQLAEAWPDHEFRWQRSRFLQSLRALPEPLWDGKTPLAGRTILLHAEQGFGDTIQYARYAPLLAAQGARVIIGAHGPLKPVLETIDGVSAVIVGGEELPAFDVHCPLLSLPALLNTTLPSIPDRVPYVRADPVRLARWAERLGKQRQARIGVAWAGNPTQEDDVRRSVRLQSLAPLLAEPAEFFSLSKFVRDDDREDLHRLGVRYFGDELTDFAESAALASLMDLVISVDTSVAHLAGALGRPLWILLSFVPDGRWLLQREDCPWYPTARLFRQQARGDWPGVIATVKEQLRGHLAANSWPQDGSLRPEPR